MLRRQVPQSLPTLLSLPLIIPSLLISAAAQSLSVNSTLSPSTSPSPSQPASPSSSPVPYPNSTNSTTPTTTSSKPALTTGDTSGTIYSYAGCWNESAGLPGTTGLRGLDGISEALPGAMTVGRCLEFCAWGDRQHGAYRLAGLEYARECWCGDALNPLTVPLPDAACDFPCDGANATACGGSLKLSVYNATRGLPKKSDAAPVAVDWGRAGAWRAALPAAMSLMFGIALAGL